MAEEMTVDKSEQKPCCKYGGDVFMTHRQISILGQAVSFIDPADDVIKHRVLCSGTGGSHVITERNPPLKESPVVVKTIPDEPKRWYPGIGAVSL